MTLPRAYSDEVQSTSTTILVMAGNILWLPRQVEKQGRFLFVFTLGRDKSVFCLLRCFES